MRLENLLHSQLENELIFFVILNHRRFIRTMLFNFNFTFEKYPLITCNWGLRIFSDLHLHLWISIYSSPRCLCFFFFLLFTFIQWCLSCSHYEISISASFSPLKYTLPLSLMTKYLRKWNERKKKKIHSSIIPNVRIKVTESRIHSQRGDGGWETVDRQ